MAKTKKSKKPTGLSITRNGMVFTFKWKKGETYGDGQQFQYKIGSGNKAKWKGLSIGSTTTSKAVSLSAGDYYPASGKKTLSYISFRVRGNKDKAKKDNFGWSSWASKTFDIKVPREAASLSFSLSEDYSNVGTFAWEVTTASSDTPVFTNTEYQSILTESSETDGAKLTWNSAQAGWLTGTGVASGSSTITEDTAVIAVGSHTRWLRIRSRGPQGASGWSYAKHVYSASSVASIISASAEKNSEGGLSVIAEWDAPSDSRTPIDKTTVQWTISTPAAGLSCSDDASWTDANTSKDTSGNDMARFSIDQLVGIDTCLFVRVNTEHDSQVTYGTPAFVMAGMLKSPTFTSVEVDTETNKATITATNNSEVPDSNLAVMFRSSSDPSIAYTLGIIKKGETVLTVQCPVLSSDITYSFGIYAFQGSYESVTLPGGVITYIVNANAKSDEAWNGGNVPMAPSNVMAVPSETEGTICVTWDWTWEAADGATISWANHEDAWESTSEPSTYTISQLHASKWNISRLDTGVTWYVRVRLNSGNGDNATSGPWSEIVSVSLSSAPSVPVLTLSDSVVTEDGSITASWVYTGSDGTSQAYSEICEATIDANGITYGNVIAHTKTSKSITISVKEMGWTSGTTHYLCVRVTSASGKTSDGWSPVASLTVAKPLIASITKSSLEEITVTDDEGITRKVMSLTVLPFSATITGAGIGGTTILAIERAQDYHMERPDESERDGFKGETVVLTEVSGEGEISVIADELIGSLDDGAAYTLLATVKDSLGQDDTASQEFEVHWNHQAGMPSAVAAADKETLSVTITPGAPDTSEEGDVCDIYRLSSDAPEIIISGGVFGTSYVDPYPAFGDSCGHRIVLRTANDDYITSDNIPAWVDTDDESGDVLYVKSIVIDFDGERINLPYNVKLDNSWDKDFERTRYLGGSIEGDWNAGVTRDLSASTDSILTRDAQVIRKMRALSVFPGICHVRTPDGSSFAADIEVSEGREYNSPVVSFSLDIKRVESEDFDGMSLEEWNAMQKTEEA